MTTLFEAVFILMLSGGTQGDVVSLLPPRDYFVSRKVEVTVPRMMELAGTAPDTPKAQVRQLLALRVLAEESEALKEAAEYKAYRRTLEEIAAGKRAADDAGFARDYAREVIVQLDGKPVPAAAGRPVSAGLEFLPADVTLLAMFDRQGPGKPGANVKAPTSWRRALDDKEKEELFTAVETLGNVQVDRVVLAFCGPKDKGYSTVRVTGRFHRAWASEALKTAGAKITNREGAKGPSVAFADFPGVRVAVVGDTDLVMLDSEDEKARTKVLDDMLLRLGRTPDAPVLPALLKKVPEKATGFIVGELGEKDEVYKFRASLVRTDKGLELDSEIAFPTEKAAEEAEGEVRDIVGKLKESFPLALLALALGRATDKDKKKDAPDLSAEAVTKLLDGIGTEVKGNKLSVRATVPEPAWITLYCVYRELFVGLPERLKGAGLPGAPGKKE